MCEKCPITKLRIYNDHYRETSLSAFSMIFLCHFTGDRNVVTHKGQHGERNMKSKLQKINKIELNCRPVL